MAQKHALAIRGEGAVGSALTNLSIPDMITLGQSLVGTGFLPNTIKTPEQAMAIMLKGQELAVPPMYALSNIAVVSGKPTCSAELMLALIQRNHGQRAIRVKHSDDQTCTVEYRLDGWNDVQSYSFTIQQAEQAGLFKNTVWRQYPAAMLRARCISAVARMAFPGSIGGMYVPGELGESVTVNPDGEVISINTGSVIDGDTGEVLDREALSRKLHAMTSHETLHSWAVAKGETSFADMPTAELARLSERFDIDGQVEKFEAQFAPELNVIEAEVIDAAQAELTNDPELQAAADAVQKDWTR